jgi:hypothetical protein
MRALLAVAGLSVACAAGTPPTSEGAPSRPELKAAWDAYSAYCSLCRNGGPCCLKEADFAPERWSPRAGPYLRAFHDYYECEYSESIRAESAGDNTPPRDSSDQFPTLSNFSRNCGPHACQGHQASMVAELDRALAAPRPHPTGALVACSASE